MKFSFITSMACVLIIALVGGNDGGLYAQGVSSSPIYNQNPFTRTIAKSAGGRETSKGLDFVQNNGQWVSDIRFKAGIGEGAMFLTDNGFVYNIVNSADLLKADSLMENEIVAQDMASNILIHQYAYKVNFVGATPSGKFETKEKRSNYNNYILGNDKSKWVGFVPLFGKIIQKDIYPGIDVAVYGKEKAPKYDFIVSAHANPNNIILGFEGITPKLTKSGDLSLKTPFTEILEKAPIAYQIIDGNHVNVPITYQVSGNNVSFSFPQGYNAAYPLVIDPELIFCTYSGYTGSGSGFYAYATTYDLDGNTYVGAEGWQAGWPVTTGAFQSTLATSVDVAINKYNSLGTNLIYSTYFGGNNNDYPNALRVNEQGDLFVAGATLSSNLPTTAGCLDSTLNGTSDFFVAHFNYTGSQLIGSTYIGGSGNEPLQINNTGGTSYTLQGTLVACPVELNFDTSGNVWVVGNTASIDFPVSGNAYQNAFSGGGTDGVVFALNPNCSQLLYGSYLGGSSMDAVYGIGFNSNSDVVVCGLTSSIDFPVSDSALNSGYSGGNFDGFVTILNSNTGQMINSTYLGTSTTDIALQLQIDELDNIYVMGQCSGDYYVSPNVYSVAFGHTFIDKLSPNLQTSLLSTVVGAGNYFPDGFLLDICGNIYVTGLGAPGGLPVTPNAAQTTAAPFWFCVLKPNFSDLLYASYFGVSGDHNHCSVSRLDPNGVVYHSICNSSTTYPHSTPGCWADGHGPGGQDVVTFKFDFQATGVKSHIDVPANASDTGCAPYTLNLNNASTSPYSIEYTWDPGDGSPLVYTTNFMHTYDSPGVYQVVLHAHSDTACITDDYDTFNVTVVKVEYPILTVSQDTLLCNLETSLDLWVNIANPTPNNSIQWHPAQGVISGGNQDTVMVDPTINTYYVTVIDSIPGLCGFASRDTVHIDFYPRILNINTSDTTVCKGTQVQVDAEASQGYTFSWTPNTGMNDTSVLNPIVTANQTETYTLTAHHPGCQDTAQTLTINVQDVPAVDLGEDFELCQWEEVALSANITPYRNDYVYEWSPSAGMSNPNGPNTHLTGDTSGWYYLNVETPIGCSGMDSVYVTVFPGNFGAVAEDTGFCQPNVAHLWASGGVSYKWTPSVGLSNDTVPNPIANPEATTRYTVYMEDVHGCKDTGDVLVEVFPSAVLNLPDSITVYPGESYHLQPGTNCVYFDWFPTNGVNSTSVSDPIFNPSVRTRYFVTAKTENGCELKDSMDVLVNGTVINVPNAFTPGNGANGIFKVDKRGIVKLKNFSVYNRWGNKIFTTNNIDEGWDGSFNGKPQPTGVYIYSVEATIDNGEEIVKRGNVTLIR